MTRAARAAFIVVTLAFLALAPGAHAESPREQLNQMVEQLQKSPSDDALREKIVKAGAALKPAPPLSEEAVWRMARGSAAFKRATSPADFQEAAKDFELALSAAPWSATPTSTWAWRGTRRGTTRQLWTA